MKLIVTGATGFVGTEVIRLALRNKAVTSIIALARRPVQVPQGVGADADVSKLHTVILEDWLSPYPAEVKEKLAGADACIWLLAITPSKSKGVDFEELTRVCHDYTMNGLREIASVANNGKLRFVYTSGVGGERDPTQKIPKVDEHMARLLYLRGRTEVEVLDFAADAVNAGVHVEVTKPSGIYGAGHPKIPGLPKLLSHMPHDPYIHVSDIAAAMIDECINGFTKETLWPQDMTKIGQRVLKKEDYADYEESTT
ncbi:NAD(P)-binding protein [Aaosphaeria arxii CBS 175.79]|uniref:NAD(P)-binding protein n=1 Tax=Aaosphaeria arxii CBS 175.79 TaxID=1450172 RepID=A0A6A5XNY4_9PLEO|nr:NAD(P)-binding protein [Aaosphaeria arxii CBS 175.79]KAF2014064.1 NAD(P)-binding protein [Aaosphaeria arxii CBS 175.79]